MADKFKTFAFTHRPRDGVTDTDIQKLCKYCRKHADFYKVITEKTGGERHIHAAFILKNPQTRGTVRTYMQRMFKHLTAEELSVMVKGLKIWYSTEFLDYMNKQDDTVIIEENLPEIAYMEALFPKKPEPKKTSLYMVGTIEQYLSWWKELQPVHFEINTMTCRDFIVALQHKHKKIGFLSDQQIIQRAKWMTRHFHEADSFQQQLPAFERDEPNHNYDPNPQY